MRLIQSNSAEEASCLVASLVIDNLINKPHPVLSLATGKTMIPVYHQLTNQVKDSNFNFSKVRFFILDEYLGLTPNHPSSFKSYIKKHFMNPLQLEESQFYFPQVDLKSGPQLYENTINAEGGIDLQLLGIGTNGHIGFNEPGSIGSSRTRIVKLSPETREVNQDQFKSGAVPEKALTMGIETIREARMVIMLALGKSKADAIYNLLNHHDDPRYPATFLKNHPHFILVFDPLAGSRINLKR